VVTPRRFERPTYRLGICRSILLSYGVFGTQNRSMRASDQVRALASAWVFGSLFCALVAASPVGAANELPDCALAVAERVTVSTIIDGGSFKAADGRTVRLAGLQAPMLSLGRANIADQPFAMEAKRRLTDLVLLRSVGLAFDARGTDRHGHVLAYVVMEGANGWLQARLVDEGLARVVTRTDLRKCAAALLEREDRARNSGRGLWRDPYYRVRTPDDLDGDIGSFQLVEGVIVAAVERHDRVYLNFGADYRTDFTVSISPRDARRMAKSGTDPLAWKAKKIRIRGWIALLNGPEMELTHPEQLEILD
jgi:micrococcal nuclease